MIEMDDDLQNNLRRRDEVRAKARGWRCPDEARIAAYVDGRLEGSARNSMNAHFAKCDYCLSQLSFLAKSADWQSSEQVPADLLVKARSLVSQNRRLRFASGWTTATAVAASLLFIFAIVFTWRYYRERSITGEQTVAQQPSERSIATEKTSSPAPNPDLVASANSSPLPKARHAKSQADAPLVRKAETGVGTPRIVFPSDGALLKREDIEFRWQKFPDALSYEVSILTAAGDIVLTRQTEQTALQLSTSDTQLLSGSKYFVSVRAHVGEGKTVRYGVVSFRLN